MPGDEKAPVKLSLPLGFQQNIFHELRKEDELLILGRGLGLIRIVTNLLHAYDAAGSNLIILVGADEREQKWIGESLAEHAELSAAFKCKGLTQVNTDLQSVVQRQTMYSKGGIFSITSQILIVDFLAGVLDPATVTGLIIMHAEKVIATSVEAFIIRTFRQKNKDGFLKALSDNPEAFTTGFAPLATMMRNLFLRKPALYPRFQVDIAKSLEGRRKAEVIELEVPMTNSMQTIQNAIMECIEASISELKKGHSGLDFEDWTLDAGLHRRFDLIVRRQLDPVWHRTSFRTRQIVRDLTTLQEALYKVLTADAVEFNKYLDIVRASSQPPAEWQQTSRQNQSPWLYLDAADTLFETARHRVYTGKISEHATAASNGVDTLHPVLEELPKWNVLVDVLEEIERDVYFNPTTADGSSGAILIMCGSTATCSQLRELLQTMHTQSDVVDVEADGEAQKDAKTPGSTLLRRRLRNYIKWKLEFAKVSDALFQENQKSINGQTEQKGTQLNKGRAPPNKRRRVRGSSAVASGPTRLDNGNIRTAGDRDAHIQSLMAELQISAAEAEQKEEVSLDPLENMEDYYEMFEMKDLMIVYPYDGDMDDHVLEEVKPRYIIMYEPDAAFIRRVEIYRSSHIDRGVRVYFLYYGGSVEEQRYLSSVRREKDAFTKLIKERGSMSITLDNANVDPEEAFLRTINTRIAGGGRLAATATPPRVVVDTREFRSSLPSLLHGRSMEIVPVLLTVGDYVLTPNIVIERKSVSDLISSLNSGRLFNQCEVMMQHYKSPMLLIEFDQNKSFILEPFADLSTSASSKAVSQLLPDLHSKLVMLTLAFPRLRIIWSSSPYQTAAIFEELKKQQEEPNPIHAVQTGLEEGEDAETARAFHQTPIDMLREIPGVTEKNITKITLEVESIHELANMEEDEIVTKFGREAGRPIYRFFNKDHMGD